MLNVIERQKFDVERAVYGKKNLLLKACAFDGELGGESACKECSNIEADNYFFSLRYPFWYVHRLRIFDSEMTELCRTTL